MDVLLEPAPVEFNTEKNYRQKEGSNSEKTINSIISEEVIIKPLRTDREYENTQGVLKEKQVAEKPLVVPSSKQENIKIIYHEVQNGETLEQLAENYGTSKEEIIEMNDLVPPFKLEEFQIIKIKVTSDILNKRNREHATEILKDKATHRVDSTIKTNFINPLEGTITKFGEVTKSGKNNGINIHAKEGTTIKSIAAGTVIRVGNSAKYGNSTIIKLDDSNLHVAYAHLKDLILKNDQKVKQGDIVGYVGSSGNVDQPQLHFAIKEGEKAVDPLNYIPGL